MIRVTNKPQFVGERVRLGKLLLDTFSGEWGTEEGESLTPVLRTSNFNEDGSLDYSTPAMRCIPERKVAKKRMVRGDIILEKSGGTPKRPVGIMAFYDSDELALCSNFNQVLRFDEDRILSRFAFHQLRWLKDRNAFERFTRKTTGLQNLQMKKLIELKLHVPQIEAQTMIADTLDKIVDNQRTLQREIIDLDSLVKSRFVEMFEKCDVRVPLGKVCRFKSGKTLPKDKEMPSGDFLYAKVGDLNLPGNEMTIRFSRTYVDAATAKNCLIPKGSVVFPKRGGAIGTNKKRITSEDCCLDLNLMSVIPGGKICTEYLLAWIEQMDLTDIANGSTVPQINNKDLDPLIIPLPKMELQQEFAVFTRKVDKSRFVDGGDEVGEFLLSR